MSWLGTLNLIYSLRGVPLERCDYPEGWVNQQSDSGIWKRFVSSWCLAIARPGRRPRLHYRWPRHRYPPRSSI
jgi:hypothetical protein